MAGMFQLSVRQPTVGVVGVSRWDTRLDDEPLRKKRDKGRNRLWT